MSLTILDRIVSYKKEEIEKAKSTLSEEALKDRVLFERNCLNFVSSLRDKNKNGIIAEFKKNSPSQGIINKHSPVEEVVRAYENANVSAISVLTDFPSFRGTLDDLNIARKAVNIPLLRKDFTIDPYQITEAKSFGADIILLIAAILTPSQINEYADYAKSIGLNVLLEIHTEEELKNNLRNNIDAIGVNNRNLHDFSVSIDTSLILGKLIPQNSYAKISESGISDPATINLLKTKGFDGFLIGENFMKECDPGIAIKNFVQKIS